MYINNSIKFILPLCSGHIAKKSFNYSGGRLRVWDSGQAQRTKENLKTRVSYLSCMNDEPEGACTYEWATFELATTESLEHRVCARNLLSGKLIVLTPLKQQVKTICNKFVKKLWNAVTICYLLLAIYLLHCERGHWAGKGEVWEPPARLRRGNRGWTA